MLETSFEQWTQQRAVPALGTNAGALALPFQGWRHFKEAFAPELIQRAILENPIPTVNCLDPFGGSGTTALACQFLGVDPTTVEVNPYLADLIEAKLETYDADALARDYGLLVRASDRQAAPAPVPEFPKTLVEPGQKDRWIFPKVVADRIFAIVAAIASIENEKHRRLFRVLLGGILVDLSNVVVSGKGRRYRRNWQNRSVAAADVDVRLSAAVQRALMDIHKFGNRSCQSYSVLRGDARALIEGENDLSLCIFSPPYPNSFDYTDVYNIELWTLGYLTDAEENNALRTTTLTSHVQVSRDFAPSPEGSITLETVLNDLQAKEKQLWDRRLPLMVGSYFTDLRSVLNAVQKKLQPKGTAWTVVGDSSYAGVHIQTSKILQELLDADGWLIRHTEPFRSMRSSPQQGSKSELEETLLVLQKH